MRKVAAFLILAAMVLMAAPALVYAGTDGGSGLDFYPMQCISDDLDQTGERSLDVVCIKGQPGVTFFITVKRNGNILDKNIPLTLEPDDSDGTIGSGTFSIEGETAEHVFDSTLEVLIYRSRGDKEPIWSGEVYPVFAALGSESDTVAIGSYTKGVNVVPCEYIRKSGVLYHYAGGEPTGEGALTYMYEVSQEVDSSEAAPRSICLGSKQLADGCSTTDAQTVWYVAWPWRVISYDDEGNKYLKRSGAMTLYEARPPIRRVQFNENAEGPEANDYAGSKLQDAVNAYYNEYFEDKWQKPVLERELEVDEYKLDVDQKLVSNGVSGSATSGYLWPLSTAEEVEMGKVFSYTVEPFWLRSPGESDDKAAYVWEDTMNTEYEIRVEGDTVTEKHGFRPAFYLDLNAVLFISAANAKDPRYAGPDALKEVGANDTKEWEMIILDDGTIEGLDGHKDFTVDKNGVTYDIDKDAVTVTYSGANTGEDEYISAIVTDSNGTVKYYGKIAKSSEASGSIVINLHGRFESEDKLYVFNERDLPNNHDKYYNSNLTDYASALYEVPVPLPEQELYQLWVCGKRVTDEKMSGTGNTGDKGSWEFTPAKDGKPALLTLKDYEYEGIGSTYKARTRKNGSNINEAVYGDALICYEGEEDLDIVLEGKSTVTYQPSDDSSVLTNKTECACIYSAGNVTIKGQGKLKLSGNEMMIDNYGIRADKDLTICEKAIVGVEIVSMSENEYSQGIAVYSGNGLTICGEAGGVSVLIQYIATGNYGCCIGIQGKQIDITGNPIVNVAAMSSRDSLGITNTSFSDDDDSAGGIHISGGKVLFSVMSVSGRSCGIYGYSSGDSSGKGRQPGLLIDGGIIKGNASRSDNFNGMTSAIRGQYSGPEQDGEHGLVINGGRIYAYAQGGNSYGMLGESYTESGDSRTETRDGLVMGPGSYISVPENGRLGKAGTEYIKTVCNTDDTTADEVYIRSKDSMNRGSEVLSPGAGMEDAQTVWVDDKLWTVKEYGEDDICIQREGMREAYLPNNAVLFASAADGGKTSGETGKDALTEVVNAAVNNEWKVTLLDDGTISGHEGHKGFDMGNVTTCDGETLTVEYSGAAAGDNEYVSAVIMNEDVVKYYGRIKTITSDEDKSGFVVIDIGGKMNLSAGDELYVFSEKVSDDTTGETGNDYSSPLKKIEMPEPEGHDRKFKEFRWTGDEKNGYTAAEAVYECSKTGDTHSTSVAAGITEKVTDPTCTAGGKTTYTATVKAADSPDGKEHAQSKEGKATDALGHSWKEATCTDPKICARCSLTEGEPLGHDWGDWQVTTEPTPDKDGVRTRVCKNDSSHVETEKIAASGKLLTKMTTKGKKALVITWTKMDEADGYEIYFTKCNHKSKKNVCKKIKTVSAGKALKYTKKKLKKQTSYKAFVMAYKFVDGQKVYMDTSLTVHCYTTKGNKKYTNPKDEGGKSKIRADERQDRKDQGDSHETEERQKDQAYKPHS